MFALLRALSTHATPLPPARIWRGNGKPEFQRAEGNYHRLDPSYQLWLTVYSACIFEYINLPYTERGCWAMWPRIVCSDWQQLSGASGQGFSQQWPPEKLSTGEDRHWTWDLLCIKYVFCSWAMSLPEKWGSAVCWNWVTLFSSLAGIPSLLWRNLAPMQQNKNLEGSSYIQGRQEGLVMDWYKAQGIRPNQYIFLGRFSALD